MTSVRLLRPSRPPEGPSLARFGAGQRALVERRQGSGPVVVLGAPGTGKTTALIEATAARVERDGVPPHGVLVLAPTRTAAARLRDRLSTRLAGTVQEPLARTPHSYAFGVLRRMRVLDGDVPPRLISGPEQDLVLGDLLAGHVEGEGRPVHWPGSVPEQIRAMRGFRGELRDLLMRTVERGLGPRELADLGTTAGRPEWIGAAQVLAEYEDVTSLATPGAYDPAGIVSSAALALRYDAELLAHERASRLLVVVDDAQELTSAALRLLQVLVPPGGDLLLAGDPDVTTQTFRGAAPRFLADAVRTYAQLDGAPAQRLVLETVWRHGPRLREVAVRTAERIGTAGLVTHRAARSAPAPEGAQGRAEVHLLPSAGQEAAFVVRALREEHLLRGTGWGSMAVVTRSPRSADVMRRALTAGGVPVALPPAELAVRDQPAARPLLLAVRCALAPAVLTSEVALELLGGPLGGADAVRLRRLRQALRALEFAAEGGRSGDELLVAVLQDPLLVAALPPEVSAECRRVSRVLAAVASAAHDEHGVPRPEADAESVLWAAWRAGGLAEPWRRAALSGGPSGLRADRDLDAVVALFEAAARFADRMPGAGALGLVEELLGQEVPADTLAERAPERESVALVSPHGAAGREWDVVVVAGVQEGTWPDLRLRSSLLGAQALADLLDQREDEDDVAAQRRAVLDDELRLFHVAVSRACRRLLVTAVRSEDDVPSPFLDLVDAGHEEEDTDGRRLLSTVPPPLSLSSLTARLRAVVTDDAASPERRDEAAAQLARLAAAGVGGADPQEWFGAPGLSTTGPLREEQERVAVSPSKVESFSRCALRWLLESAGGTAGSSSAQGVGTLVHDIARLAPEGPPEVWQQMLEDRWNSLGLGENWVGRTEHARAQEMLRKLDDYVRRARKLGRSVVAVEQPVRLELGRAVVTGQVDRLERDAEGRLVVIDLKTGKTAPPKGDMPRHPQLGVYQLAVEEGGFRDVTPGTEPGGAELVMLGAKTKGLTTRDQQPPARDEDPDWARDLVRTVAEGMASEAFPAHGNSMCRVCPVARSCPLQPEGRQVTG